MLLECKFSPVVFVAIYEALNEYVNEVPFLAARLEEYLTGFPSGAGWDDEEDFGAFSEMLTAYRSLCSEGYAALDLDVQHSSLAAWFISCLAHRGKSSRDLQIRVSQQIVGIADEYGISAELRRDSLFQPSIVSWCLSRTEVANADVYCLTPAGNFADDNVALAYSGLMQHLYQLDLTSSSRREMEVSSILWRVSGLLEAMVANERESNDRRPALKRAYEELSRQLKDYLTPAVPLRSWGSDWGVVAKYRNIATHISSLDDLEFREATDYMLDPDRWEDMRELIGQVNRIVHAHIAHELFESEHPDAPQWSVLRSQLVW